MCDNCERLKAEINYLERRVEELEAEVEAYMTSTYFEVCYRYIWQLYEDGSVEKEIDELGTNVSDMIKLRDFLTETIEGI